MKNEIHEKSNKQKKIAVNMIASLVAFAVNMIINFFLSPYIIENVGVEANGFVSLANNFVTYASIATIALNSMAARFIAIEYHKGNKEEANKYFNSVLIANIFISLVLLIPVLIMIIFLNKIINIPVALTLDVKFLFGFVFFNFIIGLISTTFSVATFIANRLDLSSKRTIDSYVIKGIILYLLFTFTSPKVAYIGFAATVINVYLILWNIKYTKKFLPDTKISLKYFEISKIIEIIKSGIWNTITMLGQVLADGLDLLICNLWINPVAMGQLSIAKTFSGIISNLLGTVSSIFRPQMVIYYAKNQMKELVQELKLAMKITGCFANIPLSYLIVFGSMFYSVWVPSQDIQLITILTILTVQGEIISGVITPMYSIYSITNKIKADALIRIAVGLVTVAIVFIFVKFTSIGIYAIAATSIIIGTTVNVTFVPVYVAKKCLNEKWYTFYPLIFRFTLTTLGLIATLYGVRQLFPAGNECNWLLVFMSVGIAGILGLIVNWICLFNRDERKSAIDLAMKFLKKGENV